MKVKVMSIFGTRPEAIKMAPLIKELEKNNNFESVVCVTGQHREMLDQVLEIFNIRPKYDLDIMKKNQTLTTLTTSIIKELENVYTKERPNIVLVHGDTTTTFSAALSAFYHKIDVAHIEAGLRSNDMYAPFPEEANRRLTSVLSTYHFAPTNMSKANLLKERINEDNIYVVGNTVIDSMKYTINTNYKFKNQVLKNLDFTKKIVVVTAHRRENWGTPMMNICKTIKRLAKEYNGEIEFVFLSHLNPVVKEVVYNTLEGIENVKILAPIDIEDAHNLLYRCFFVMTDSGGIQEEAPYLSKYVLVLRSKTERQEVLEEGMVKLVGTDEENIYKYSKEYIDNKIKVNNLSSHSYGDGDASLKIVNILEKKYVKK